MAWYLQKLLSRPDVEKKRVEKQATKSNGKQKHSGGDRQSSGTVCIELVYLTGLFTYNWITEILTFSVLGYTAANEAEISVFPTRIELIFSTYFCLVSGSIQIFRLIIINNAKVRKQFKERV